MSALDHLLGPAVSLRRQRLARHRIVRRAPDAIRRQPIVLSTEQIASSFQPHPLLASPHLQTLVSAFRRPPKLPLRPERLELPDGDFVDLAWADVPDSPVTIVLVPGVAGDASSPYVAGFVEAVLAHGWSAVVLHLRGCGPEPNRLRRCHHHGDTEDLRFLCRLLRRNRPRQKIAAVGWSLGAGVVIKAMGEDSARSPLFAGAAISAPLRLRDCAVHMRKGLARIYEAVMMGYMKEQIRRKHARVPLQPEELRAALSAPDILALGAAYTAPVNGFADIDDYCRRATCGSFLSQVRRPALVLQAADDPMLGPGALPDAERWSKDVCMEIATHGGHIGFVSAGPWGQPAWWSERRVLSFLDGAIGPATI